MTVNPQRNDELRLVAQDSRNGSRRRIDHAAVERAAADLLQSTWSRNCNRHEAIEIVPAADGTTDSIVVDDLIAVVHLPGRLWTLAPASNDRAAATNIRAT